MLSSCGTGIDWDFMWPPSEEIVDAKEVDEHVIEIATSRIEKLLWLGAQTLCAESLIKLIGSYSQGMPSIQFDLQILGLIFHSMHFIHYIFND